MESLTEASADSLLDLTPNYDAVKQTFLLGSQKSESTSSVRFVTKKLIPAQHPPNAFGGGSNILDPTDKSSKPLHDTFSGLIDGISGDLIHGTRSYILTKEEYEGPFHNNMRHGEGAIVKNVYQPSKNPVPGTPPPSKVGIEGSRFYGTYLNDSPHNGTLVVPGCCTYHGFLFESRPHGEGTIVQSLGHKYEGGFRHGLYHGHGIETETENSGGGVYNGQFLSGVRQGYGTYSLGATAKRFTSKESAPEDDVGKERKIQVYEYKGQWNDNKRQGEGEEEVLNGEIYRGQFHSNERHGYGILTFPLSQPNSENTDNKSCRQITPHDPSKILISAEGIWRAGIPLNGTHGWTLTYQNEDVYTGFASNFIPFGYGVKRFINKDIYSGEWKNGKKDGEGIFIAANGREEYIGAWKDDKILPTEEGKDNARRITLTDLTMTLLNGEVDSITQNTLEKNGKDDNATNNNDVVSKNSSEHKHRRELLGKIMHKSLSTSLDLLRVNSVQSPESNEKPYPQSWPLDNKMSSLKEPKTYLYKNAIRLLKMENRKNDSSNSESDFLESHEIEEGHKISQDTADSCKTQLITYPNEDSYLGEICTKTKNREGHGVYLSVATGSTYSGNFEANMRNGFGMLIHPLGKYCGDFVDDEKHGIGTLILNDSSSYYGEFQCGSMHGRGTICEKDGTVYVGEWRNGVREGDGYETLADSRVYMGEYKAGKRHGVGTMLNKSGGHIIYSGSWNEGLYHDEGVVVLRLDGINLIGTIGSQSINAIAESEAKGSIMEYEGSFCLGHLHGYGTLTTNTLSGAVVCKGNWQRNKPVPGKWRIQFSDGSIYSGEAKTEEYSENRSSSLESRTLNSQDLPELLGDWETFTPQPDGFGTIKYVNGDVFIGSFIDGKRHGRGTCEFANGDRWEGEWINDSMNKKGNRILTLADGKLYRYCDSSKLR